MVNTLYSIHMHIVRMYTTHNFKMVYVYINDMMGDLHASNRVVLIEVSFSFPKLKLKRLSHIIKKASITYQMKACDG